jgi:hypothetical protein
MKDPTTNSEQARNLEKETNAVAAETNSDLKTTASNKDSDEAPSSENSGHFQNIFRQNGFMKNMSLFLLSKYINFSFRYN